MDLGTCLITIFCGPRVGKDEFGNRYYQERRKGGKRWVYYSGMAEPSKVPPEWHGWLHYTVDLTPLAKPLKKWSWVKAGRPNLTGTKSAYCPKGDLRAGGKRVVVSADYQPWQPN